MHEKIDDNICMLNKNGAKKYMAKKFDQTVKL